LKLLLKKRLKPLLTQKKNALNTTASLLKNKKKRKNRNYLFICFPCSKTWRHGL